ncbi:vacuolar lysine transporter YPQ1-like [Henckelia pumila]|uniref:vacuolar lysine transporter YPQ1-like n=1 Tax=Henckelia pumila TaxID=405737 RepID=UPI003C6E37C4
MKPLKLSYCAAEKKPCMRWIEDIFKDCLCNINDEISFAFGVLGLISWAVAEIPQIITNFSNKSANGVSLAFLSTWIIGDVLNLVGCILEPATLPTQFYTAVLYTTVTVILAIQCLYYNHFCKWSNKSELHGGKEETEPLLSKSQDKSCKTTKNNVPVDVPYYERKFYFTSARSLAGSDTPPTRSSSYIKARSGPPVLEHDDSSSEEDNDNEYVNIPSPKNKHVVAQPRPIPRPVVYGTFAATSANLPRLSKAFREMVRGEYEYNENKYGQLLGWVMAAIYMGGRIPQIWLNIQRGSVEGLNPLMFVFALVANATYVASILVRTIEWKLLKANMPWLLDAIVCVALDSFIIIQYIFYKYIKANKSQHLEHHLYRDYVEADK